VDAQPAAAADRRAWNEEVESAFSFTLMFETAFAIPAM